MQRRRGRKLMLATSALIGGVLLGTVAAAAPFGDTPTVELEVSAADHDGEGLVVSRAEGRPVRFEPPPPPAPGEVVVPDYSAIVAALAAASAPVAPAEPVPPAPEAPATTAVPAPPTPEVAVEPAPAPAPPPAPAAAPAPTAAPAAPPPTSPPPPPEPTNSGSAEDAIAAHFPDVYDQAVSVARCESSMNPGAVSPGGGNHGLFQINNVHRSSFEAVTGQPFQPGVYDADANARFARHLYDSSGWGPWACQP